MTGHLPHNDNRGDPATTAAPQPDQPIPAPDVQAYDHPLQAQDPGAVDSLDSAIGAAARRVFLDPAMLRPGPGLVPFGGRARRRRERRHQIDDELRDRRQELVTLLRTRHRRTPAHTPSRRPLPDLQGTVTARIAIGVVLLGVLCVALWFQRTPAQKSTAPTQEEAGTVEAQMLSTSTASTAPATSQSDESTASTALARPGLTEPDLSTPQAAALSWLMRWCPFNYRDHPEAAPAMVRLTMTDSGWAELTAEQAALTEQRWPEIVADRQIGFCTDLRAAISLQATRTPDAVVVVLTAVRTITSDSRGSFEEPVTRQQRVVRGADGRWRVDVAQGGA